MKLHYSKALSISMIVVGVLLALVGLLGSQWIQAIAGILITVVGILMTVNPMVVFEAGEVQVRSPAGFTARRFAIAGPQDLSLDGSRLTHVPTGKKITSLGFGANKSDAERIRTWVQGTQPQG